jgi:meiotic recombination protein SPO11
MYFNPNDVLQRIDAATASILAALAGNRDPIFVPVSEICDFYQNSDDNIDHEADQFETNDRPSICKRSLCNISTVRGFTSSLLVMSFVQNLILSERTATNREVYYYFVTHFRNQKECDSAILDVSNLLGVPRISMGICASPRSWYSGNLKTRRRVMNGSNSQPIHTIVDGRMAPTVQGYPVTREWIDLAAAWMSPELEYSRQLLSNVEISTDAKCILVVEKEGAFTRLNEDKFYDCYSSILITSKGFPDIATRAMVFFLHHFFQLPVYGLCDCNPFGVAILQTFYHGSERRGVDGGDRYRVPIQWAGLRPSHVHLLQSHLPAPVLQRLTDLDRRLLTKLSQPGSLFLENGDNAQFRLEELQLLSQLGYKVELEALLSIGMNYLSVYVEDLLVTHELHDPDHDPVIL